MEVVYTVHNPHIAPNAHRATVKGQDMVATVDTFEVELVSEDRSNGTIKLRFIGDAIPEAQSLFANDAQIAVSFAASGEKPAEQEAPPAPPPAA